MADRTLEQLRAESAARTDECIVHDYMERFTRRWMPADRNEAADFQADLLSLIQAVHRDASRPFGDMLSKAFSLMPHMIFPQTKEPT